MGENSPKPRLTELCACTNGQKPPFLTVLRDADGENAKDMRVLGKLVDVLIEQWARLVVGYEHDDHHGALSVAGTKVNIVMLMHEKLGNHRLYHRMSFSLF